MKHEEKRNGLQSSGTRGEFSRTEGVALVMVLTSIAILAAFLTEMHESTGVAYASSVAKRDELRAEYLAKSGVNLTRLLVAQEPVIRQTVSPLIQMMTQRAPSQIPVWEYANEILGLFADFKSAQAVAEGAGINLKDSEGLGDTGGKFRVVACAENRKVNINDPLSLKGDSARKSVAMQLFTLIGGYKPQTSFDDLFSKPDADGLTTQRLDVVSSVIDWWDYDQQTVVFDPGSREVSAGGAEDNPYSNFDDAYQIKNAPFDSLEELRLVRGVGDRFWGLFVQPEPGNPCADLITVYGSGAINPNEAAPEAMLARVCSYASDQPLCNNVEESAKFIQLVGTARSMAPVPWFSNAGQFLDFMEGKGKGKDLYPTLKSFLGEENPLLFTPIKLPKEQRKEIEKGFDTVANVLTILVEANVGRARHTIHSIVNFHDRWVPPPPNAATNSNLGVVQYWRIN